MSMIGRMMPIDGWKPEPSDGEKLETMRAHLSALLVDMDEWLGNEDGLMIEDVIGWRDTLAAALDKGPRA